MIAFILVPTAAIVGVGLVIYRDEWYIDKDCACNRCVRNRRNQ